MDKAVYEEVEKGKPLMGICLGMQMLFEKSFEYGEHKGLGLIKGSVAPLKGMIDASLKIPHIGWNALNFGEQKDELFKYVDEGDFVYFVHSFHAIDCDDAIIATSEYDISVTAAVRKENVMGCQFHPEKSGKIGLSILKAFCEI
jgi:glutamine amidotransferase